MYEIEFRAKFDRAKYDELKMRLDKEADLLGQDNKDVLFYILPDKLLKVVHNTSKNTAKISLKLNRLGAGASFEEYEFHFNASGFDNAKVLVEKLGLQAKFMQESQTRINYQYNGCEIALKHSETWGYHMEIEIIVENQSNREQAEKQIADTARELGVTLMTDEEIKTFTESVETKL
jgi:predicted adenylyl cyclase CyaB